MSLLCLKPFNGFASPWWPARQFPYTHVPTLKQKRTLLVSHHLTCLPQLNSLGYRAKETQSTDVRIQIQLPSRMIPSDPLAYQCFLLPSWLAWAHWPAPDSAGILTSRERSHQTSSELGEKTLAREEPNGRVSHVNLRPPGQQHIVHCAPATVQDSHSPSVMISSWSEVALLCCTLSLT